MKRSTILYLAIATISILFLSCNPADNKGTDNSNSQHQIPLGMRFENTNKLAGIPLASTPFGGDELPKMVDLSDKMPPVGNQGQQQSCVAWAIAYALKSYQEKVQTSQQMIFSPSYIYNQINNGMNAPTLVTDALNLLSEQGVCPMNDMPYNEQDWTSKPNEAAMQDARKFRIDFWRQVNTQDIKEVKAQLAAGYPVIIGADVSKDFIDGGFNEKANFVWKTSGQSQGGHCMLLTGYNDDQRAFRVMNSWGTTWGDNGFSWIDYTLFPQVVKYGFVAKDAINTNNNLVRNELNNNPQNNNTILPNNNTNPQNNTQPENPNNNTENFYKPTQDIQSFPILILSATM